MILHDVEVEGVPGVDVRLEGDRVAEVGPDLVGGVAPGEAVLDGHGGALLPGLHDHHLHLRALARARSSVPCGPPHVRRPEDLDRVLHDAAAKTPAGAWLRGVGHDERRGGALDRRRLDALAPDHPVRIQHRSGHLWVLSSRALAVRARRSRPPPPTACSTTATTCCTAWTRGRPPRRRPRSPP